MTPHLERAEAEIFPGLRVLHDEALLSPVGLLDQDEVVAELREAAHGEVRTTFSPGGDAAHHLDPVVRRDRRRG